MAGFKESIKDYEKIRAYMREFYVYGFKTRMEYDGKSARTYDDERRRIESYLGDRMRFVRTDTGKTLFLSIDSRGAENPLFRAYKAKSFTDGDITLWFLLFDILYDETTFLSLGELTEEIDRRLGVFREPMLIDPSTLRKKLREYSEEGLIVIRKEGKKLLYGRASDTDLSSFGDLIDFFREIAPAGTVGSFLSDRLPAHDPLFSFKHHDITGTLDDGVLTVLLKAMHEKRTVSFDNAGSRRSKSNENRKKTKVVPLRIYISTQSGRRHLAAYHLAEKRLCTYRLDYLSAVTAGDACCDFDTYREMLTEREKHMWGVNCGTDTLSHVSFTVRVEEGEEYIIRRLDREKRCGFVTRTANNEYTFSADLTDVSEIVPWIRSFFCRIVALSFSDKKAEKQFRADLSAMAENYGITEDET